jgi:hypothetical protein
MILLNIKKLIPDPNEGMFIAIIANNPEHKSNILLICLLFVFIEGIVNTINKIRTVIKIITFKTFFLLLNIKYLKKYARVNIFFFI